MAVVVLFTDGVGVGRRDAAVNPLARSEYLLSRFEDGSAAPLPAGGTAVHVDPTFDVPGRPQSASNQAALLTGDPAPQLVGRHVLGFPDAPLRTLLAERSIVRRLVAAGRRATLANAYPAAFLDALGLPRRPSRQPDIALSPAWRRRARASAVTLAMGAGQVLLRTFDDARAGEGLTHDVDGAAARGRGVDVPSRSAGEAADVLLRLAAAHELTWFEHHLADEAGHAQDFALADSALSAFDGLVREVVARKPPGLHVVVCSDHGNVEDLSTRNHTRHPVPVLHFGPGSANALEGLHTLADVGRRVLELAGGEA
ncbi:MAG: metalloenzyme [Deltaproteobacteria bacterium]|nr:metalloenzyme [Deltaproteobacteria bacterium]